MKAVIFDCDGTLVDSEGLWHEVLVAAVAEQGLILSVAEAIEAFRGGKMADCLADLEARLGHALPADFEPALRARIAEVFRARLRPFDGAIELVRSLSSSRSICVASSGPPDKIATSLSLTGLWPFFEGRVFSSYDVGVWKPDPGLFPHAARAMGVAPEDCAVLEDSLPGIRAGLAAGMTVFAFQPQDVDPRIPAGVTVLKSLLELRSLLGVSAAEAALRRRRAGERRNSL